MLRATLFGAAIAGLMACQADSRPRYVSEQDHFSIIELPGWTEKRDRGSVVFVGSAADGLDRNTIVIRAVPREGDWVQERTFARVAPATTVVLEALPGAKVSAPTPLASDRFEGARFELSFAPRGKDTRYERTHVVLLGDLYLFHIIHTSPEGDLHYTAGIFDEVVASLREEA